MNGRDVGGGGGAPLVVLAPLPSPLVFSQQVVRTLGRGSFARCLLARRREDGFLYAIKQFLVPFSDLSAREQKEVRQGNPAMFVAILLLFLTAGQCSWLAQPCCLQRFPHQHVGRHPAVWDCTIFGCDVNDTRCWWVAGSVLFFTIIFFAT
jgi:hypothetical protein